MKATVLLNPDAGKPGWSVSPGSERLQTALAAAGIDAVCQITAADQLTAAAAAARGASAVVIAAGGDGTVSAVARGLAGSETPLGILPFGTLNHFARDLHIPADTAVAARIIAAGHVRRIDLGELNGRPFINNSSIGIYPSMVSDREDQRARWRRQKWFAMGVAALHALHRLPLLEARLDLDGSTLDVKTPLVFVGNNRYELSLPALGVRHSLESGELSVHVANCVTRWGILRLAARGLTGRLRPTSDFAVAFTRRLSVWSERTHLSVALDGEVVRMVPPLEYRICPGALSVLAPPVGDG